MSKKITDVRGVVDWRLCLGCGACAYICPDQRIRMVDLLDEGIRPSVGKGECGECRQCLQVCPAYENDHTELLQQGGLVTELAPVFGPVLEMWEGHAVDEEIRHRGSSGGVLTALGLYAMESEGMHGVLQIGGDPDDPICNRTRMSRSRAELLAATGSRYAPASACDRLGWIEAAPAPCVFVGQPTEVTALRKAQRLRPALDAKVGLALSFFCAGSPPTRATLDLLASAGIRREEVAELRYRGLGWPGHFAVRRHGETTFQSLMTYEKSWGILQKSRPFAVHLCPDSSGEDADISCGDPWYREIRKDEEGASLVLVRTSRGRRMVQGAVKAGVIRLQPVDAGKVLKSQVNLARKRGSIGGRIAALRAFGLPAPRLRGFSLFSNWRKLPVIEKLKSTFGTARRILQRDYRKPSNASEELDRLRREGETPSAPGSGRSG